MKKLLPTILCTLFSYNTLAADNQSYTMIEKGEICALHDHDSAEEDWKKCMIFCRRVGAKVENPSEEMRMKCDDAFSAYVTATSN